MAVVVSHQPKLTTRDLVLLLLFASPQECHHLILPLAVSLAIRTHLVCLISLSEAEFMDRNRERTTLLVRSSAQPEPNKKCFGVARTQLFQDGALENLLCIWFLCFDCAVLVPPGRTSHWTDVWGLLVGVKQRHAVVYSSFSSGPLAVLSLDRDEPR